MTDKWPDAYCWLYAPFLLETTTSAEFEHLSHDHDCFKSLVNFRQLNNWSNDDNGVSKAFATLYKICDNGNHFQSWIKHMLKKPNLPASLNTFEPTLALLTQKMKEEHFKKFFGLPMSLDIVSRITAVLDVHHVVEKMDASGNFSFLVTTMKPYLQKEKTTYNNWVSRCKFLLLLFASDNPPNLCWYMEFLRILTTKATTRPIVRFIDANYEENISYYEATLKEAHLAKVRKVANFASPDEPSAPRPQSDFGEVLASDKHVDDVIKLYDYQHELANKAVAGENTIVCAPTGSGKTVVAAYIIREHLRRYTAIEKSGRAIVFVPTVILVEQQTVTLQKLLGSEFSVASLCGAESKYSTDKVLEVMSNDVLVMTPQVFLNLYISPFQERKIYIRDFTLMIFDECHHCDKKHPYRIIMRAVLKNQIRVSETRGVPQVVGLTASVGTGDVRSADSENVISHITGLCARMGATTISSVQHDRNIEEMKSKVPKPVDDFITVYPPEKDEFAIAMSKIARDIELNLKPTLKEIVKTSNNLNFEKVMFEECTGSQRLHVRYTAKLDRTKQYVMHARLSKEEKAYAYWLLEYLLKIHYALKYNELLPSLAALQYFEDAYDGIARDINAKTAGWKNITVKETLYNVSREIWESLKPLHQMNEPEKNVLQVLTNQIKKQYDANPDSRILIFIDLRRGCYDLYHYLKSHPLIISTFGNNKVSYLVSSSGSKREDFVLSRAEQIKRRNDFETGKINIIVTTSVSDEGVDVAACNLVIKYNSVGSEKTYIQRRGRARAVGGRAVLIALGMDTGRREFNNVFRECIMNRCLHLLTNMTASNIREQIEKRAAEQTTADLFNEKNRNQLTGQNFIINCVGCATIIGETSQLRLLEDDTVVLRNPGIWSKLDIDKPTDHRFSENTCSIKCATAKCLNCKCTWGPMVKYADLYFVSPRLDNIRIDGIDLEKVSESWTKLMRDRIYVKNIEHQDLAVMFNAHLGEKERDIEVAIRQQVRNIIAQDKSMRQAKEPNTD